MPTNSSASMFGGAGGRGSRVSVASLEGLRNVLRNETERDSAPVSRAAPLLNESPVPAPPPVVPADDKQTLRGLNDRLSGYLNKVKQLQEENQELEKQIDDILAKRKAPEGRDWDKIQEPLDELKNQMKDITTDNAKLLLMIDNTKLANDDFKNKLEDEVKAKKELEKDLENLKKIKEDTKVNRDQIQKEIDLVKDELARLKEEHQDEVDVLREMIKNSEVNVEIESQNSNLGDIINNIRVQYDKVAQNNLKETEDWYKSKFDNIKVEEAQNVEAFQSGKSELKELLKQKKLLEIQIQAQHSTIRSLEDSLGNTKAEYGQQLGPLSQVIVDLEADLKEVKSQVELQMETNKNLLCVKMKLEQEINSYEDLIHGITANADGPATA
ncbi:keratin, type I cytoskeletal 18 isoform X1 [Leuresthes tenuis]|uniref:keratin, type I cytoskeletal 18 isoform X1 n=1 Tax=Leuresthes tenuis TaxID=355514 RepID=UPI003B50B1CE